MAFKIDDTIFHDSPRDMAGAVQYIASRLNWNQPRDLKRDAADLRAIADSIDRILAEVERIENPPKIAERLWAEIRSEQERIKRDQEPQ